MNGKWPPVKLGKVIEHRNEFITIDDLTIYQRVTAKLHARGIVLRDYIEGGRLKTKEQQLCKAGDFLVAEIDAKVGGFGIVPEKLEGAIVSSHYYLFEIDERKLEKDYLGCFIKTRDFQKQISARGSTNYAAIRPGQVLDLEIPLPPLQEQNRIVATIESLMAKIEAVRRLRAEVVKDVEGLVNSALQNLNLSDLEVIRKTIGECSSMKTGKTPSTRIPDYYGDDTNWYCPSDLTSTNKGYPGESHRKISYLAVDDNKATMYEKDTILLVAIGGSIGKVAITKEKCSSNQQITGITFNEEIDARYGYYWMMKLFSEIVCKASQATLPIINQRKIRNLEIKYPKDMRIQHRIVTYLDSLKEKVDELRKLQNETEEEIEELTHSILDKAFGGEL